MAPALGAAGIGNLAEKRGEGLHLRGAEHDFGTSDLIRRRKNGLRQQRAGVGPQGLDEDHLGRLRRRGVPPAECGEIPSCSRRTPSSPPDTRSRENAAGRRRSPATPPHDRTWLPNRSPDAFGRADRTRDPRLGSMPGGQDEKAAVVDDQLQAAIALAKVPTDPAVARRALEGGGGKAQQRHPFLPPGGDVPERLADLRQSPQVVVLPHQFLVARLVAGPSGPDYDLTQVQGAIPRRSTPQTFQCFIGEHTTPRGSCPEQITTA